MGLRWLANLHSDPQSCVTAWASGRLAGIPVGVFEVLRVSASLGYAILRDGPRTAAVLHTVALGTADFFLSPGSVSTCNPGVRMREGVLPCPAPGRTLPRRRVFPQPGEVVDPQELASAWLVEPDGGGLLRNGDQQERLQGHQRSGGQHAVALGWVTRWVNSRAPGSSLQGVSAWVTLVR